MLCEERNGISTSRSFVLFTARTFRAIQDHMNAHVTIYWSIEIRIKEIVSL